MRRSFRGARIFFHPSTLAVFSGACGAVIGFLINVASGGHSAELIWIALSLAIVVSLTITAWQVYTQEKTGQQWMVMLQEMVFQTYFLAVLADKQEISQIAQQRLGQVLKTLSGSQQVSMLRFFSHNGLPATYIGDALHGSKSLAGADLQRIALPGIDLGEADLSRANLAHAILRGAELGGAGLRRSDLTAADLSRARLVGAYLPEVNLSGADLTGADLTDAFLGRERSGRGANLSRAVLLDANLQAATLTGADLSGANLRGADLTKANLSGANLSGADLTGATLTWASLDGVDLRTAKVADEQLRNLGSDRDLKRAI